MSEYLPPISFVRRFQIWFTGLALGFSSGMFLCALYPPRVDGGWGPLLTGVIVAGIGSAAALRPRRAKRADRHQTT